VYNIKVYIKNIKLLIYLFLFGKANSPLKTREIKKIMAKMTKTQIMSALAEETGLSKKEVTTVVETMVDMAYKEVKKEGEFTFPGLGKLVKVKRKARKGRNPATGEEIDIPAKTVTKFRLAKAAKDAVA